MNNSALTRLADLQKLGEDLETPLDVVSWASRVSAFLRAIGEIEEEEAFSGIDTGDLFQTHAARMGHLEGLLARDSGGPAGPSSSFRPAPLVSDSASSRILDETDEDHDRGKKRIVVFAALYQELDRVFDERATRLFPAPLDWARRTMKGMKIEYWSSQVGPDHELIAVTPDSMGLTETAILAAATFQRLRPDLAAMIGTCAGRHEKGLRLGHLVVPTQSFHYQFGAKTDTSLEPEIRAETVDSSFSTHAQRISGHRKFQSWMSDGHPASMIPKARSDCHVAPIACSDLVAKWDELLKDAAKMDRKVVAIDMESYAFLRAAKRFGISNEAFVVKCVTDYADRDKDDSIREWAQVASARFFYLMLVRWLDATNGDDALWPALTEGSA